MAVEKGNQENGQKTNSMSDDKLQELILGMQKKIDSLETQKASNGMSATDIAAIVAATIEATKKSVDSIDMNYEKGIDESLIPPDDYMDAKGAVKFFAPCGGYAICDDLRKGQRVLLPWGKKVIFFENPAVTKIQRGKYEELLVISEYTSRSKKEVEWLREHRLFRTKFFESTGSVQSADLVKMSKMSRIMSNVQAYELPDLLKAAQQNGVEVSQDYEAVRFALAEKVYNDEAAADHAMRARNFLDNSKDQLLREKMVS